MPKANLKGTVSLDDSAFSAGVRRVKMASASLARNVGKGFKEIGTTITRISASLAKFAAIAGGITFAAATAGAYKLSQALKGAFDTGGALSDLSSRTGIAVKELVILEQAFRDNGLAAEKVGPIINKMQKGITDFGAGLSTQVRAFERLGISYDDISRKSPIQQFQMIQRALNGIEDQTLKAGTAMEIFGRSGGELQALFNDVGAIGKASVTIGTAADILDRNANKFDRISDLLNSAGAKLKGFTLGIAEVAAPKILEALERFNQIDFADIGIRFAKGLNLDNILSMIKAVFDVALAYFGNGLANVFAAASRMWGDDMVSALEDFLFSFEAKLKNAFQDAFKTLAKSKVSVPGFISAAADSYEKMDTLGYNMADNVIAGIKKEKDVFNLEKQISNLNKVFERWMGDSPRGLFGGSRSTASKPTGPIGIGGNAIAADSHEGRILQAGFGKGFSAIPQQPFTVQPITEDEIRAQVQAKRRSDEIAKLVSRPQADAFGNVFRGLNAATTMQLDRLTGIGPGQNTALTMGPKTFGSRAGAISRANLNGLAGQGFGARRRVGMAEAAKTQRRDETIGGTNQRLDKQLTAIEEGNRYLKKGLDQ